MPQQLTNDFNVECLNISNENLYTDGTSNCTNINSLHDMAYVIYTSGSTGKPKGVMIEHRGAASLSAFFKEDLGVNCEDRIIQFASLSFDASVWEVLLVWSKHNSR